MPSIRSAFVTALNIGRNPSSLYISDFSKVAVNAQGEYGGSCIIIKGSAVGGSEPHQAIIVIPNIPPLELFKPSPRNRLEKARWHCDCPDFRFTFHPFIKQNDFHLEDFPEYIPNGRGSPRAIAEYGMCKHVMALVNKCVHDRVFSPLDFMKNE